jgi:hypothetical protein
MEEYYAWGRWAVIVGIAIQFFMLWLQMSALLRHGQRCFLLLAMGTLVFAIYIALAGLPYFVKMDIDSALFLLKVALGFAATGSVLAVWGTALLFRSYRRLREGRMHRPG